MIEHSFKPSSNPDVCGICGFSRENPPMTAHQAFYRGQVEALSTDNAPILDNIAVDQHSLVDPLTLPAPPVLSAILIITNSTFAKLILSVNGIEVPILITPEERQALVTVGVETIHESVYALTSKESNLNIETETETE